MALTYLCDIDIAMVTAKSLPLTISQQIAVEKSTDYWKVLIEPIFNLKVCLQLLLCSSNLPVYNLQLPVYNLKLPVYNIQLPVYHLQFKRELPPARF